jgi:drug/metabolite transporter (DMT)-like permease
MSQNKNFTAVFLLITLSLIWGTSFILIKQGLKVFTPDVVGAHCV